MKISNKEIIQKVKKKEAEKVKENITFRLSSTLVKKFRDKCNKEDVQLVNVIEELMKNFIKE